MADTTTELEVLDEIVDTVGGTSGQHETVVPVLQQIKELLASGGAVADGSITTAKLANGSVTRAKLDPVLIESLVFSEDLDAPGSFWEKPRFIADSMQTKALLQLLGVTSSALLPSELSLLSAVIQDSRIRLAWANGSTLDSGALMYSADLQTEEVTLYANGLTSRCSGVMGVDDSWTVTPLPTDGDGVSY